MALKIKWTPEAKSEYNDILDYLHNKWPLKEVQAFAKKTEQVLSLISITPEMYPLSKRRNTRKCVLVKQVNLYYRIGEHEIELLSFWSNYKDPKKLKH